MASGCVRLGLQRPGVTHVAPGIGEQELANIPDRVGRIAFLHAECRDCSSMSVARPKGTPPSSTTASNFLRLHNHRLFVTRPTGLRSVPGWRLGWRRIATAHDLEGFEFTRNSVVLALHWNWLRVPSAALKKM